MLNKLTTEIARRDILGIENLLREIENVCMPEDILYKQYFLFAKTILADLKGENSEKTLVELIRIIRLTKKDFEIGKALPDGLHTYNEIVVINAIAVKCYHMQQMEYAIELLQDIKKYMDNKILDQEEKAKKYPMILLNLSSWLNNSKRYKEALELCEEGIWVCKSYGKIHPLPELFVTKGVILANLSQKEKAKDTFQKASHLFDILEREKEKQELCHRVKKEFAITL